ncbi:MAG: hypothetical protein PVJ39_14490 [Gammaproteobacteria bacterium]|jgi:hypothetical protein
MTDTATKSRPPVRLHTVKVTPISTGKKSADKRAGANSNGGNDNGANGSHNARPDTDEQERIPFEDVVNRGLDLAETGIGLGVNIVARLGSIFKDQVFDKINTAEMLNTVMNSPEASQSQTGAPQPVPENQPPASSESTAAEQTGYLFNRLPLYPGGNAYLSFSINNDSLTAAKHIELAVESFAGESHQHTIESSAFSLTPAKTAIAPADFEKFILMGTIPEDTPPDIYHGRVIVTETQTYRIPVVLVISRSQDLAPQPATQKTGQQSEPQAESQD